MVPLENSVEGSVAQTLDELATGAPLTVIGEAAPAGDASPWWPRRAPRWTTYVGSAPTPTPRRRRATGSPRTCLGSRSTPTTSTAAAAAALADGTATWDAAICAPFAAERLRPRGPGRGRRRQPVGRDPLRAGVRPAAPAVGLGRRQDLARALHRQGPPGRAARDPHRVRRARDQPHPDRVPPDRWRHRRLLLLHRRRGPRRRRSGSARRSWGCAGSAPTSASSARTPASTAYVPTLRRGVSDAEYHEAQAWLSRVREGAPDAGPAARSARERPARSTDGVRTLKSRAGSRRCPKVTTATPRRGTCASPALEPDPDLRGSEPAGDGRRSPWAWSSRAHRSSASRL